MCVVVHTCTYTHVQVIKWRVTCTQTHTQTFTLITQAYLYSSCRMHRTQHLLARVHVTQLLLLLLLLRLLQLQRRRAGELLLVLLLLLLQS